MAVAVNEQCFPRSGRSVARERLTDSTAVKISHFVLVVGTPLLPRSRKEHEQEFYGDLNQFWRFCRARTKGFSKNVSSFDTAKLVETGIKTSAEDTDPRAETMGPGDKAWSPSPSISKSMNHQEVLIPRSWGSRLLRKES